MNKKAQIDIIFYILVALVITTIFFNFARDYSGNESFFRDIALNEIKLSKDTVEAFQGNSIYKFHLNISKYKLNINHLTASLDDENINFLGPSITKSDIGNTEFLYLIKTQEGLSFQTSKPKNLINSINFVNVPVNLPRSINFINLDKTNTKLDLIQQELTRSFKAKSSFKVNTNSQDSITIYLKSNPRKKNLMRATFSFDKSDETKALSRKLGSLILNEFVKNPGLNVNIKPVKSDTSLNDKNTAIILEIESKLIESNPTLIPTNIETAIEALFK